jgi:hypothetical protein
MNIWGDKVPRSDVVTTDMFKGTGCEVQADPDTIGRPWCQFDQPIFSPQFECFFFKNCGDDNKLFSGFDGLLGRNIKNSNDLD